MTCNQSSKDLAWATDWLLALGLLFAPAFTAWPQSSYEPYTFTTLAGMSGGPGDADGTSVNARFRGPNGVARDAAGNIYVADTGNHTIRKIAPDGFVTTFAGKAGQAGATDGSGVAARFRNPQGLALDGEGNIYVADTSNCTIRKVTPAGAVTTFAGAPSQAGSTDGSGNAARFRAPGGIAVDVGGNIYVADSSNHNIRKISPARSVTTLAGSSGTAGALDGLGTAARFSTPSGLAVDEAGNLYVADTSNHLIRKVTPAGLVTTVAGSIQRGSLDGVGTAARFYLPSGVAVTRSGTVYISDMNNYTIRKMLPTGRVSTLAGRPGPTGSVDGSGATARFFFPRGVCVDDLDVLHVADSGNSTIRKITSDGVVTTFAGSALQPGSADGTNTMARFNRPHSLAVDGTGSVYVTDGNNYTLRKITPAGVVTTLAGGVGLIGSVDGSGSEARFSNLEGIGFSGADRLYVVGLDQTIRMVTTNGVATTLAGSPGQSGVMDGIGAAARFYNPSGVTVDRSGDLYVSDLENHTIRKVTPTGVVTTWVGAPGQFGSSDATGAAARFYRPAGLALDGAGNLYAADSWNSTIRKVSPIGEVTTFAGSPGQPGSADGTGRSARFNFPHGLALDGSGNLYVADTGNHLIRKITQSRVVTTLAGLPGGSGDSNGTGNAARFWNPTGIAVDAVGTIYVADTYNNTVRVGRAPVIRPILNVTFVPGSINLSWDATAVQFALERAVAVGAGADWRSVTNAAIRTNANQIVVEEKLVQDQAFYRLRTP